MISLYRRTKMRSIYHCQQYADAKSHIAKSRTKRDLSTVLPFGFPEIKKYALCLRPSCMCIVHISFQLFRVDMSRKERNWIIIFYVYLLIFMSHHLSHFKNSRSRKAVIAIFNECYTGLNRCRIS